MANRYWVGGTATWDGTIGLKWALTSGGVGGQLAPTSADTVFFDANSGANTVTIGSGVAICSTLTMTGFTGTLAFGSNSITIAGTGTIYTGATTFSVTGTPLIICSDSSATARTISPTATTEANAISFNITAGTGSITLSNASYKNVNFTGFTGTLAANARTIYGSLTLGTGMTVTDNASVTTFAGTTSQQNITNNGVSFNCQITMSGTQTVQLQDALTITSARIFTLTTGTLDLNSKTLTCGFFSSNNSNTRSILFGTGNITITGSAGTIWNFVTATGFSYTGTPTVNATYNGATGTRIIANGTAAGSETNAVSFNISAGTDIVSLGSGGKYKNLNFTGFAGTLSNNTTNIFGDLTLSSGMTLTAGSFGFLLSSTLQQQNITTNGNSTIDTQISFAGTQTYQLQDNLTIGSTRTVTLTSGTLDLNGKTLNCGLFSSSNTNTRALKATNSTITLTGTGTVWSLATTTGMTLTSTGSTISFSDTSVTGKTFAGGGLTYNSMQLGGSTGVATYTFTGANTWTGTWSSIKTVASTITLPSSTTTTVGGWTIAGSAGNLITLNSSTSGTQATLNLTGGGRVSVDYLSIKDSAATPSTLTWYAGANSTNTSNNTGWIFTIPPAINPNTFFLMFN